MNLAVWSGTRYPINLYVRPDTSDVKAAVEVIDNNAYQRPRLGFTIDPGDVWVDAGANIGAFSALVEHLGGSSVGVEPIEDHVLLAQANTAQPVLGGVVTPPGDTTAREVYVRPGPVAWRSTSVAVADAVAVVTCNALPIDDLVAAYGASAVKLDIEGDEIPVMERWHPPDQVTKVVWEWSFNVDPRTARLLAVIDRYRTDGWQVNYPRQADRHDRWPWFPQGRLCFAWR